MPGTGDPTGAVIACANKNPDTCFGLKISNNIVGGVATGGVDTPGFVVPAHDCFDYQTVVFKNNTAHSVQGYGASIY